MKKRSEKGGSNIILFFLFFILLGSYFVYSTFSVGLIGHVRNKVQNVVDIATSRASHEVLTEGIDEAETIAILQELGEGITIGDGLKTNKYVKIDRAKAMTILENLIRENLGGNVNILFCSPVLFDTETGNISIYLENPTIHVSDENVYTFNGGSYIQSMSAKSSIESFIQGQDSSSDINYKLNVDFTEINKTTYLTVIRVESAIMSDPVIIASFGGSEVYRKY